MHRSRAGFTLIELLVTVSVVALLLGAGLPAFRRFGRVQELAQAADQVKAVVLETRAYALSPRAQKDATPAPQSDPRCPVVTTTPIDTYAAVFAVGSNSYVICEGNHVVNESKLSSLITIASAATPITFSISGAGAITTPVCAAGTTCAPVAITITHNQLGADTKRAVIVNRVTGAVSITP